MIKFSSRLLFLLFLFLGLFSCNQAPKQCTISGIVHGITTDTLLLKKIHTDMRFIEEFIPVVDGRFEYVMSVESPEAYELTLQSEYYSGGWRSIRFFPDKQTVEIELFPDEDVDYIKIVGGKLNKELLDVQDKRSSQYGSKSPIYQDLNRKRDSLMDNGLFMSQECIAIEHKLDEATDPLEREELFRQYGILFNEKKSFSPEANAIEEKIGDLFHQGDIWTMEYIVENPSIVGYALLLKEIIYDVEESLVDEIMEAYDLLAKKYPNHVYTNIVGDILGGSQRIKVGGKFVDFTLPDPNGNIYTLSKLIEGKVAIIDLWATYCGPCIKTTRTYKPIYEEFKDKGFTIVGVAAERGDTKAMEDRIEKEGWEWVNMVDLDRKNNIWHKYDCSFAGGRTLMVDQNGVIVALGPTDEEVRELLFELL